MPTAPTQESRFPSNAQQLLGLLLVFPRFTVDLLFQGKASGIQSFFRQLLPTSAGTCNGARQWGQADGAILLYFLPHRQRIIR